VEEADPGAADGRSRKRDSWSLKTIVENVAGRPITEFQDPDRPVHPYIVAKMGAPPGRPRPVLGRPGGTAGADSEEPDPVDRVYPPLVGRTGRELHGPDHEHHGPTLREFDSAPVPFGPGIRAHTPGPSRRPERIYLHYLLLHMDRLSDHALEYLKRAIEEEMAHRSTPPTPRLVAPPPA